jgi:hypothetical protein
MTRTKTPLGGGLLTQQPQTGWRHSRHPGTGPSRAYPALDVSRGRRDLDLWPLARPWSPNCGAASASLKRPPLPACALSVWRTVPLRFRAPAGPQAEQAGAQRPKGE